MSIAVASADTAATAFNGESIYASDRIALGDWRSRRDRAIAATASLVAHLVIFGGFAATVWSPAPPLGGPSAQIVQLVSEAELFGRAAGSGLAGSGARTSSTPRANAGAGGGDGSLATGATNGVRGGTGSAATAAPRPLAPTDAPRPREAPRAEPRPAPEPAARPATNAAPARRPTPAPAPARREGSASASAPTGATGGVAGASPGASTGAAGGSSAGAPNGVRPRILVPLDGYGLSPYKLFVLCSNRTVFALSEAEENACNDRQWAAAAQRIVAQNAANPFADEAAFVDNDPAWIAELERRRRRAKQNSIGSGVPCDPGQSQGATQCRE